jgi:hypothetical protein
MTPDEHYDEAERLLDGPDPSVPDYDAARQDNLAEAQIHATLALAGFTRDAASGNGRRRREVPRDRPGVE